jgi:hypothetical protein
MNLFKENPDPKDVFDKLILEEQYAEAFSYAVDNHIEREALKICIGYIQEDDEELRYNDEQYINNTYGISDFITTLSPAPINLKLSWYEASGNSYKTSV